MQQRPSSPFVSSGYQPNQSEISVPPALVPSQQKNQRYLHSLGQQSIGMVTPYAGKHYLMVPDKITTMFHLWTI